MNTLVYFHWEATRKKQARWGKEQLKITHFSANISERFRDNATAGEGLGIRKLNKSWLVSKGCSLEGTELLKS